MHLITEYVDENMMIQALEMKKKGSILSFEPLVDVHQWTNKEEIISFMPNVDCISPDWPTACGFSGETDPLHVMKWWIKRGATCITLRDGRRGSYGWDAINDKIYHIPIIEVPRIDPTGCGNSYAGGTAVGWEKYKDVKMAAAMGTVSATFMIQVPGIAFWEDKMRMQANIYLEQLLDSIQEL
jgi:sugar/nucleoside kinase (ribokinase family)